jgi:hypothetical protein
MTIISKFNYLFDRISILIESVYSKKGNVYRKRLKTIFYSFLYIHSKESFLDHNTIIINFSDRVKPNET